MTLKDEVAIVIGAATGIGPTGYHGQQHRPRRD